MGGCYPILCQHDASQTHFHPTQKAQLIDWELHMSTYKLCPACACRDPTEPPRSWQHSAQTLPHLAEDLVQPGRGHSLLIIIQEHIIGIAIGVDALSLLLVQVHPLHNRQGIDMFAESTLQGLTLGAKALRILLVRFKVLHNNQGIGMFTSTGQKQTRICCLGSASV